MKRVIIVCLSIIVVIGAIITAGIIYNLKKDNTKEIQEEKIAEEILDDCTEEYEEIEKEMILSANSKQEKISPNASITFNTSYEKCGHTTSKYEEISADLVNKTEGDLKIKYPEYDIAKFSDTQIILQRTEKGNCGEHYRVKDKDGVIIIYEILDSGEEKEYEITDISTEYLTSTDKINMKNGIDINGKQALNQLIEDFE